MNEIVISIISTQILIDKIGIDPIEYVIDTSLCFISMFTETLASNY